MDVKEVLMKAREFLLRGWTQTHHAVDAEGRPVGVKNPAAVRFCVIGALARAVGREPETAHFISVYDRAFSVLAEAVGVPRDWEQVALWNDRFDRTLSEVLGAMDRAVEAAGKETP